MSHFVEFDYANRILRCRFEGDVTNESLRETYKVAAKCAALANPRAGIADFSDVISVDVSARTVLNLAYGLPAMPASRPRVLVAPSDCAYGLARMFQQCGSENRSNVHVVRSLDEAYTFLGIREPKFAPVGRIVAIRNEC